MYIKPLVQFDWVYSSRYPQRSIWPLPTQFGVFSYVAFAKRLGGPPRLPLSVPDTPRYVLPQRGTRHHCEHRTPNSPRQIRLDYHKKGTHITIDIQFRFLVKGFKSKGVRKYVGKTPKSLPSLTFPPCWALSRSLFGPVPCRVT